MAALAVREADSPDLHLQLPAVERGVAARLNAAVLCPKGALAEAQLLLRQRSGEPLGQAQLLQGLAGLGVRGGKGLRLGHGGPRAQKQRGDEQQDDGHGVEGEEGPDAQAHGRGLYAVAPARQLSALPPQEQQEQDVERQPREAPDIAVHRRARGDAGPDNGEDEEHGIGRGGT